MVGFGDLRLWAILLGMVVVLMVASAAVKAFTGRDLDPPDDGGL